MNHIQYKVVPREEMYSSYTRFHVYRKTGLLWHRIGKTFLADDAIALVKRCRMVDAAVNCDGESEVSNG